MASLDVRSIRNRAPGDNPLADPMSYVEEDQATTDPMKSDDMLKTHKKLLEWYYHERDKQAANRMEMAMDCAFYDNEQWNAEDAAALRERGQMPLVYNEVAPMVDWLIGTERRTRVDWKVLPRNEDDVDTADAKTKVLKYVGDVNSAGLARSRAFADAMKAGLGWVDDGARDDPTKDVLYSEYEDWRNVLHDSNGYDYDLGDSRYLFRWRWIDEDIALAMFPDSENAIKKAIEDQQFGFDAEEDKWFLGEQIDRGSDQTGQLRGAGTAGILIDAKRRRVRLIEAQYREPCACKIVGDGPMKGAFVHPNDYTLMAAVESHGSEIVEKVTLRMHVALFTEADMLSASPSIYRHNRFSLTPVWCYRRGRDRLPYGAIRRVRDIQQDLNKRASKALFMLNTNQIEYEKGAFDDPAHIRDEADRPDGMIERKKGYEVSIRRDTDAATGQIQMMTLAAQSIQKTAGVNNENLGRQTNAISGAAIEARQSQGSVGTTEPFDNYRYTIQWQGEKQLSLTEQFYSEEKVIRLTGAKSKIEWLKINQPEQQPDGTVRYLNDIASSQADFVVSESDYAGTLRQAMFDSLVAIVQKMPPEVGLRIYTIAMEFSDLPNAKDVADAIRKVTGEPDPDKQLSPEEQQQIDQQKQMQDEAMQMQREQAKLALEEQQAKIAKLNAEAQAIATPDNNGEVASIRQQAADQVDALSQQLQKLQMELANRTMQIKQDNDTKLEVARLDQDTKLRIAEIQKTSDEKIAALNDKLSKLQVKPNG